MTSTTTKLTERLRICCTPDLKARVRATASMEDRSMEYQARVLIKRGLMYTELHKNDITEKYR